MNSGYKKSKARIFIFIQICIIALFALTCQQSTAPKRDTVVIGLSGDIDSLNELTAADTDALQIIKNMLFMTLTRLDKQLQFTPYLAKQWDFSDDRKTLTFVLRHDVYWTDGPQTTADDVLFTYKLMTNPDIAYPAASRFELIKRVEKIDDFTIRFHFARAYPDVLFDLQFPVLPEHILGTLSPQKVLTSPFNRQPIGNGPFILQKWQANQAIYFSANKNFALGAPSLDQVIFSIIPEETVLIANLLSHEIDVVPRAPYEQLSKIEADKLIRTTRFESNKFTSIGWNGKNPLFTRPVRRALTYAIDKKEIIDTLLQGYGKPQIGPLTPMVWAFDRNLKDIEYDLASAKNILAKEGWKDSNHDGVLEKDNKNFSFTIKVIGDSRQHQAVAVMVQAQLKKLGVEARIERLQWNLFIDHVFKKKSFDAVVLTWESDFTVNPTPLWHSSAIKNGYNLVSYVNPRVDALLEQARAAQDQEQAEPLWREFQQIIIDDCPYTFLFIPDEIVAYNTRLVKAEFDVRGFLANVQNWKIQ